MRVMCKYILYIWGSENMLIDYSVLTANALGFSLAIVWNETVMKAIDHYYPGEKGSAAFEYLIYAIAITLIVIIVVMVNNKISNNKKKIKSNGLVKFE